MLLCLLSFLYTLGDGSCGEIINPVHTEVYGESGTKITLSCNYSSAFSLYWYRQYPGSTPQFLLLLLENAGKSENMKHGMSMKLNEKKMSMDLEIFSVKVNDTAVYYCARKPTVSGNSTAPYKNVASANMCLPVIVILVLHTGNIFANTITSHGSQKQVLEGESVTLTCNYSGVADNLQWYRKNTKSSPEFLLYIYESGMKSENIPPRLSPRINKDTKQIDLEISSAAVTDSALYYCALKPTVTGKHNNTIQKLETEKCILYLTLTQ
ncbi:uncharacterized protein LOC127645166 [Xyrauchen texanus]|uniref:uncharacterized protein LOC127645166 n=1 Tax=Xyrauchen texanus TaxID=154827 RepID=UPI002242A9B5|nr:uncharacterized protein LOC127645166 [Xyrauchen texanus]